MQLIAVQPRFSTVRWKVLSFFVLPCYRLPCLEGFLMLCFTPLALTHEGSLERSSPTSFTLLAVKYEGIFKGPLTPRSLSSATLRPSVPVPDCFQLSNRKP